MNDNIYITGFKRGLICTIDVIILGFIFLLIIPESKSESALRGVVGLFILVLYFILMGYYFGATLGQKLFKVKIIDARTGNQPTLKQLLFREVASLTALTGIGFILASFTYSYYSGFYWDRWSKTKVIPSRLNLVEFNKKLDEDRKRLFPE